MKCSKQCLLFANHSFLLNSFHSEQTENVEMKKSLILIGFSLLGVIFVIKYENQLAKYINLTFTLVKVKFLSFIVMPM